MNGIRQRIERAIVSKTIRTAYFAGYSFSLEIDGDWVLDRERDLAKVFSELFQCDDDRVYLFKPDARKDRWHGWIWFIYGNSGYDVISDYTTNLEPIIEKVNPLINKYEKLCS